MAKNSQTYDEAVIKLKNDLDGTKALPEIRKLFTDFYRKFTMIPSLWIKWLELERTDVLIENIKDIAKTHFFHPCFDEEYAWKKGKVAENLFYVIPQHEMGPLLSDIHFKPTNTVVIEKLLHFPHYRLNEMFKICDAYGTQPLSKSSINKYHQSQELLKSIWGDKKQIDEKWYQKILKMEDQNFIRNSFEYYLGGEKNYKKIHIWKAYIEFLQTFNPKLTLNVYSKYCRLFVDDLEMRENYRKKIEKMNKLSEDVSLWWIDLIEIERQFVSFSSARRLLEKVSSINKNGKNEKFFEYKKWFRHSKGKQYFDYSLPCHETELPKDDAKNLFYIETQAPLKILFSPINEFRQTFSLPFHYMTYLREDLRKTSNYEILQKLYETCKFFFAKSQIPLCHRLGFSKNSKSTYFKQSLFLNQKDKDFDGLNGVTLTNTLQIPIRNKPEIASIILSKISKFEIKHLQLYGQHLTEKELDLLSGDKIKTIALYYIEVTNLDGNFLSIEKIMDKFPNADTVVITFFASEFNDDTAENFAKMNRSKNLMLFYLGLVPATFNEHFFYFVNKFAAPNANFHIQFDATVEKNYIKEFKKKSKMILHKTGDIRVTIT